MASTRKCLRCRDDKKKCDRTLDPSRRTCDRCMERAFQCSRDDFVPPRHRAPPEAIERIDQYAQTSGVMASSPSNNSSSSDYSGPRSEVGGTTAKRYSSRQEDQLPRQRPQYDIPPPFAVRDPEEYVPNTGRYPVQGQDYYQNGPLPDTIDPRLLDFDRSRSFGGNGYKQNSAVDYVRPPGAVRPNAVSYPSTSSPTQQRKVARESGRSRHGNAGTSRKRD